MVAEERTSDEVRALTEEAIQVQTARVSGERPAYLPTTSTPAAASLISPLSVLSPADISPLEQGYVSLTADKQRCLKLYPPSYLNTALISCEKLEQ